MHVVVVENILDNHLSHAVNNNRPQAYDTELLDLDKTCWEENTPEIHIYFYTVIGTLTWAGYFRDFPQKLNLNIATHDTTHTILFNVAYI